MRKLILLPLVLLLLLVTVAGAEDAPLTLLEEPAKGTQQSGPAPPQLAPSGQIGQGGVEQMTLYDIYGVVPTKTPFSYFYLALGLIAFLTLAALLYWLHKRRNRPVPLPIIPPWDRALMDLKDARDLFTREEGRDYMARVSQILRHYVEDRFAIKSTRQTTREFLAGLKEEKVSEISGYRVELQQCLEQADMAKFAHKSQDEESLIVMEQAVTTFVQATSPKSDGEEKR